MGTIAVSEVIARVGTILHDPDAVRWTNDERLRWINDGQREVARRRPRYFLQYSNVALAAGTRQDTPSTCFKFMGVTRDMGADGSAPGRAITETDVGLLSAIAPTWYTTTAVDVPRQFMRDLSTERYFHVYPPAVGGRYVELEYAVLPTEATLTGVVNIPDEFVNALIDYVLSRAYAKEAEEGGAQRAAAHYAAFQAQLSSDGGPSPS